MLGAACSPVSAHREIGDAQTALTRAEQRGAARSAVYEHTAAVEFLHKAREEDAHAEFEAARLYAKRSVEFAHKAEQRVVSQREGREYRQPEPVPPPPSQAAPSQPQPQIPATPPDDGTPLKRRPAGGK